MKTLYIQIDDSGKLSINEQISVYGGILFFSKEEKDKFINQYRSIINSIKEKTDYKNHLELKHNNLKNPDKRRIINYLKKYYTFGIIINNSKVYKKIIFDKKSKGRYNEYCQRILIKNIIKNLLKKRIINKYDDIKLVINIDEQSTKTNGYYSLENGLYEELIHGIINYNYAKKHMPLLKGNLIICLHYQKSINSLSIQAADIIAGFIRKKALNNEKIDPINSIYFLP